MIQQHDTVLRGHHLQGGAGSKEAVAALLVAVDHALQQERGKLAVALGDQAAAGKAKGVRKVKGGG